METIGVIEIPQGSLIKYEYDKQAGALVAERVLNQPTPYNYGYIPNTLAPDGDPLDVFVLGDIPLYPLSRVKLKIIGILKCVDNGDQDDKIIACMDAPVSAWYTEIGMDHIRSYLTTYKSGFVVQGYADADEAQRIINLCEDKYALSKINCR